MKVRVCFVCLGNICRSPTAEGVFRQLVADASLEEVIEIDSAGTGAYHVGESPDRRSTQTARQRGITLEGRARQFLVEDFDRFDYVVAMDSSNREALHDLAPDALARAKVSLLRDFIPGGPRDADVPDPYYGGGRGFEEVLDLCETACRSLLTEIQRAHDV